MNSSEIFGGTGAALSVVIALVGVIVVIVAFYYLWPAPVVCPKEIIRNDDGSLTLKPTGQVFPDMNTFQQWFHSSGAVNHCPLPVLQGDYKVSVPVEGGWGTEQTYATTPIYKVDDYEFSRVFGYERAGHMDIPPQDFNLILEKRAFDWADRPVTSDERRTTYAGLKEGFTASGELKSERLSPDSRTAGTAEQLVREAVARYGSGRLSEADEAVKCKISREAREVADMVAKSYESDPDWEPVVTQVGANHWEVTELKPRHRRGVVEEVVNDSVVNTANDAVDIQYRYPQNEANREAIDPFFTGLGSLPFDVETKGRGGDPFYGPVPGMERMMGPTFDHKRWY
jgi:hypothetical protein